jgi:hypothetical protein
MFTGLTLSERHARAEPAPRDRRWHPPVRVSPAGKVRGLGDKPGPGRWRACPVPRGRYGLVTLRLAMVSEPSMKAYGTARLPGRGRARDMVRTSTHDITATLLEPPVRPRLPGRG